MEIVSLKLLAKMLEISAMDALEIAKRGNAICTSINDKDIFVNLDKIQQELEAEIIEELEMQ